MAMKSPTNIYWKSTSHKFYVFTELKKGKGSRLRIERKAGSGTCKIQRTNPVKDSQNNHDGFRKYFTSEVKGFGSNNVNKVGHWINARIFAS